MTRKVDPCSASGRGVPPSAGRVSVQTTEPDRWGQCKCNHDERTRESSLPLPSLEPRDWLLVVRVAAAIKSAKHSIGDDRLDAPHCAGSWEQTSIVTSTNWFHTVIVPLTSVAPSALRPAIVYASRRSTARCGGRRCAARDIRFASLPSARGWVPAGGPCLRLEPCSNLYKKKHTRRYVLYWCWLSARSMDVSRRRRVRPDLPAASISTPRHASEHTERLVVSYIRLLLCFQSSMHTTGANLMDWRAHKKVHVRGSRLQPDMWSKGRTGVVAGCRGSG